MRGLDKFDNIEVIPNYSSALSVIKGKNPILLVGNPNYHFHEKIK